MNGLTDSERMGLWLEEHTPPDVKALHRCPESDGGWLVRLVNLDGHEFLWFAPNRVPGIAWTREISELRDDLHDAPDGQEGAEEISAYVREHIEAGEPSVTFPSWAIPADAPLPRGGEIVMTCGRCRRHYRATKTNGVLSVSRIPADQL